MSVVGIDIGIKNLAVCQRDSDGSVLNWALIDCVQTTNIKNVSVSDLVRACTLTIDQDQYSWIRASDVIGIESQPFGSRATASNNRMRCIQSCIETWAAIRAPHAKVISIGARAKNVDGESYSQRKKNAVLMVSQMIEADPEWSKYFESAGAKRDDLADAFLIAKVAVERSAPKARGSRKRKSRAEENLATAIKTTDSHDFDVLDQEIQEIRDELSPQNSDEFTVSVDQSLYNQLNQIAENA